MDRNVVFRLKGETGLVHESCEAGAIWRALNVPDTVGDAICLVSGRMEPIARIHPPIHLFENLVRLVSFDKDKNAFSSYGHKLAANAPTGISSAFAYTTVLNRFLAQGSDNRVQIGDASTVFWLSLIHI